MVLNKNLNQKYLIIFRWMSKVTRVNNNNARKAR